MTTSNPLGAAMAAEHAIRLLLRVRNHVTLGCDARFYIRRHLSAIRLLRCVA